MLTVWHSRQRQYRCGELKLIVSHCTLIVATMLAFLQGWPAHGHAAAADAQLRLAAAAKPQSGAGFEQEWSKLISAAQQEGTVMVASGGAPSRQYRPVMDAFTKKYAIKVEVSTGNATDTVNRVLAERKAGKHTVDVALISSRENNQRLVPSESLVPFTPLLIHPDVIDTANWYMGRHWYADKESRYVFIYHVSKEDQYETWYNTEKLKDADI